MLEAERLETCGNFAMLQVSNTSDLTNQGTLKDLSDLRGWELVSLLPIGQKYAGLLFQTTDQTWEYDCCVISKSLNMRGFVTHDRRETVFNDLEEKIAEGWRVVAVCEVATAYLLFLLKRPVEDANQGAESL